MKTTIPLFILLLSATSASAQDLSSLVAKNSTIEKVASGFSFTEGPAAATSGEIFFTDQPNNAIHIWNEKKGIRPFEVDGERANGLYFNADGDLVACADFRNKLIRITMYGEKTVLAASYDGKHLNGPNDLWIHPNGNIYFTDSYYHRNWWPEGHKQEQDCRGVYCLYPDGHLVRLIDDYKMPNGIIGTPDGTTLYVADIQDGKTWKYTIRDNGTLSDKTFFAPEGSDGMTIDEKGNVYLTNNAVSVFAADGHKIGELAVPERPANVTFGGKNRKVLFITARTSVYTIRMNVKGVK
ncbi:MAG: SMP-30/gluconolactonase/LRE family protein [Mangrovibacterium sp.]|nr:SMP-30/gluconolactonase/LRE family protein [Mangrovibacterium sp.]